MGAGPKLTGGLDSRWELIRRPAWVLQVLQLEPMLAQARGLGELLLVPGAVACWFEAVPEVVRRSMGIAAARRRRLEPVAQQGRRAWLRAPTSCSRRYDRAERNCIAGGGYTRTVGRTRPHPRALLGRLDSALGC